MRTDWLEQAATVTIASGPAAEPISRAFAKQALRLDSDHFDDLVDFYITAAREYIERVTDRALITQTLDLTLDDFPPDAIELPRGPVQSVTTITTYDADDVATVQSSAEYRVDTTVDPPRVALNDGEAWPTDLRASAGVVVRYVAGYADTADAAAIPAPIRQALIMLVNHWFEQSTAAGPRLAVVPLGFDAALSPYRAVRAG